MNTLLLRSIRPCRQRFAKSPLAPSRLLQTRPDAVQTDKALAPSPKPVTAASFAHHKRDGAFKCPKRLLIYHSPPSATAWIGIGKATTFTAFGFGCLVLAPALYFDDNSPLWMVPACIAGSAIPMIVVSFLTTPYIANVFIQVPAWAQKSRLSAVTFARRMPPDTALEIQKIGFLPVPRTRTLQLSELRTLKSASIANFEHVPRSLEGKHLPLWRRMARYYLFARPRSSYWRKTIVPEIWPLVVEQAEKNAIEGGGAAAPSQRTTGNIAAGVKGETHLPTFAKAIPRVQPVRRVGPSTAARKKP